MIQSFLKDWRVLSASGRVLVLNGFSFNFGFYMLLPYLGSHLETTLGFSTALVGAIIGLRVLSQQGLFLVGGTLGDKFGYRRLILGGCLVRVAGFALLGMGESFIGVTIGAFLSGFAGALFTPSSQAYLAYEAPDQIARNRVFALQNFTSVAGMLLGPLVGLALLQWHFAWVGGVSAALFLLLFFIQWRYLPTLPLATPQEHTAPVPFWRQWWSMLRHRAFMAFILCASVYSVFFHQLYIIIPHQVHLHALPDSVITQVFVVTSLLGVSGQMPISRWVERDIGTANGMWLGMATMGSSYLWLAADTGATWPFVMCAIQFSLGSMLVFPLLGAHIPNYAPQRELAAHYGLYSCIGGVFAFVGNASVGVVFDSTVNHWLIWLILSGLGIGSGAGLWWQVRREQQRTMASEC